MRLRLFEIERDKVKILARPQTTFTYSCQIDIIAGHRIIFTPKAAIHSTAVTGLKKSGCRLIKKIQRRGARKIDPSARSGQAKRRRTWLVRCSEAIERNEAYGTFSPAC
jgi:hypothetical protein